MKTFAAALFAAVASAKLLDAETDFMAYISKYGKHYEDVEEFNLRFERFQAMEEEIRHLKLTQKSSKHGHNHLSDWTIAEKQSLLGLKNMSQPVKDNKKFGAKVGNQTLPTSVDWRTVTPAVVNPVKDQGQCGSCWSFASTAVMESAHAIFHGVLYSLSEQNLVSCSFLQGNLGCNGGWYYYAWNYAVKHPIETEADYPYTSGTTTKSGSCMYNSALGVVSSISQTDVLTDTTSIMTAIVQQPQAVAIEADTAYFQTYTSGILTCATCCGSTIDHAVTAVGYGNDPTYGGYYIVRNSWSASWGDQGYVNIGMADSPGICGINQYVAFTTTN
jgi:C1A family cysteine protease